MNNPSGAPECFGQIWSDRATECSGGYDPGYVGKDGGKVRPRCDYYDACKTRVLLTKQNQRPALIPPQSLLRPSFNQPAAAVPYQNRLVPGQQQQTVLNPLEQHRTQQQSLYQHPGMPIHIRPMEMMPVSHSMPAYLSQPEVRMEGESYWAPLGREIFRGIGKALGHSVAHFFDHIPFTKKE